MSNTTLAAAFRVRFSEFQEHLGKTMRAIAIEEEVEAHLFAPLKGYDRMKSACFFDHIEGKKL